MAIQQPLHTPAEHLTHDQAQALKIHNEARETASKNHSHPRPALVWDAHLAADAEKWARHLANQNKGLQHSTGDQRPGEGENLFWMSAGGDLADASQGWVNERKDYHGEKIGEGNFEAYGHFTQVIWPTTTRVGLASAKSSEGGKFIVGRYSAPGNFTGESAFTGK